MEKKILRILYAVVFLGIVLLLGIFYQKRPVSIQACTRAFSCVATAIYEYEDQHGCPPATLADLEDPSLLSYRELPIQYVNNGSNFSLSMEIPPYLSPKLPDDQMREADERVRQKIPDFDRSQAEQVSSTIYETRYFRKREGYPTKQPQEIKGAEE